MNEVELQAAIAREDLCRYLAACYYEPDPAFEEEGVFRSIQAAASAIDEELVPVAQRLAEAFRTTTADELLLDYTRLFLGPTNIRAQPYGSVWLEEAKTLMGDTTMAVVDLYGECGFEIDDEFREVPDHIAVELEFLYLLIFRENEARRGNDVARVNEIATLKKRFLEQHLGRWVAPFTAAVRSNADSAFYRHLATLTGQAIKLESRAIPPGSHAGPA